MKTYGLMFTQEMIKAYFAGRKTHTRRLRGLKELNQEPDSYVFAGMSRETDGVEYRMQSRAGFVFVRPPYGWVGDGLYFKEVYALVEDGEKTGIVYRADGEDQIDRSRGERWRSSMMIKRIHSRVSVPIVDVKLQRLHEMTERDSRNEGVENLDAFRTLWDRINAAGGYPWTFNPWVWDYEFPQYRSEP